MLIVDLCLKIYFWPFLSYLASLKGLCPYYPPGYYPTTATPPNLITAIPTFQPTPPTTLPPCPADPLVCLANGERPIPYCPCIDPRQQNGQTTTTPIAISSMATFQNSQLELLLSYPSATETSGEVMIFSRLDNANNRRKRKTRKAPWNEHKLKMPIVK